MIKLRDYQQEAVYSVFRYFDKYKSKSGNPLIVLPTGTGKSIVIAEFIRLLFQYYGNQPVLMLTHVKELIEQNYSKLMTIWPTAPCGIYSAGLGRKDRFKPITFAGIASVAKKAELFRNTSLILVDEAHTISPAQQTTYQKFFNDLRKYNPHIKIIGLTATDWRTGYGSIVKENATDTALFDKKVFDASTPECFNWFISEGYLVPVVSKRTGLEYDVTHVKKTGGDYNLKELQLAVNVDILTHNALEEAKRTAEDEGLNSWLIFCSGVEHAFNVKEHLIDMGVSCEVIHGGTDAKERAEILERYKCGEITAIANNNVLTTGFDHPELDLIVMLRPTTSPGLWVQMLGRGTRAVYADGFDLSTAKGRLQAISASCKQYCRVLDFSGNTRRIGPINDPVKPERPGKKKRKGDAPVKECAYCGSWNHASARFCGGAEAPNQMPGFCGHEFEFKTKLKKNAETKELIKTTEPITEVFDVRLVTYSKHINRGDKTKPPMLKVTYDCGHKNIEEYVGVGHTSQFAQRKAIAWWRGLSTDVPVPQSVDDALNVVTQLKTPTQIRVWTNRQFPEILAKCFDGSRFGELPPSTNYVKSEVSVTGVAGLDKLLNVAPPVKQVQNVANQTYVMRDTTNSDDVPF